jgi:hypothetical protein
MPVGLTSQRITGLPGVRRGRRCSIGPEEVTAVRKPLYGPVVTAMHAPQPDILSVSDGRARTCKDLVRFPGAGQLLLSIGFMSGQGFDMHKSLCFDPVGRLARAGAMVIQEAGI